MIGFSVLHEMCGTSNKIVLVAFDLLYLNGGDLRKERRAVLKRLIAGTAIQFSERAPRSSVL
ncbi:hypothetical protein [Bradyrhizobium acaciae]|uniref:hypothetical protein n=1 Tax=Bradyrhizobium acaciae TaxID=2683706 RepID=UPI003B82E7C1|nr:hypothetical protein [Bradyrhizobium acaciae]